MTRARVPQNTFSSGEIDPLLFARDDFQRFKTGLSACRGFLPLRQGAVTRAPGSTYQNTTRNNLRARRLPFEFARNDAVELEFTNFVMRVWRYGNLVQKDGAPFKLDTPWSEADLRHLETAQDGDIIYVVDGRNPMQKISRFALDDWRIDPVDLKAGPFKAQNTNEARTIQCSPIYDRLERWEGSTRNASSDIIEIGEKRRHDERVYIFRGQRPVGGALSDGLAGPSPPTHTSGTAAYRWTDPADETATYESLWEFAFATASEGNIDLTGSGDIFQAHHVGVVFLLRPTDFTNVPLWVGNDDDARQGDLVTYDDKIYRLRSHGHSGANPPTHTSGTRRTDASKRTAYEFVSTLEGIVRITEVIDANRAKAEVLRTIPQPCIDDPSYRWAEGAWSAHYGYPTTVALYERRMFAASSASDPRTIWASTQGAFEDHLPGDHPDSAFAYEIESDGRKNRLLWLRRARRGLYIGALGEVWRAFSSDGAQAIGPTTFDTELVAADGSADTRPIIAYGDPVYITRDKARVQKIQYSFEEDGSRPLELSLPSQHLGQRGIEQIVWQSAPLRTAWMRNSDGDLIAMVYDPDQDVLGWATVPLAGGFVEDLCVSSSADGARDVVSIVVRRDLPSGPRRCVEILTPNLHTFAAAIYEGDGVETLTVPHLADATVEAWTDKGAIRDIEVDGAGKMIFPYPVGRVTVGLFDPTHYVETLPIVAPARDGDARGRKRKLGQSTALLMHQTGGGTVATVERDEPGVPLRLGPARPLIDDTFGLNAGKLVTGIQKLGASSGFANDVRLQFRPDGASPLTLLGIVASTEEAAG